MIRFLSKYAPNLQLSAHLQFGQCPARCQQGRGNFAGPTGRVYRSSRRSLTMQCTHCGLLWTMTVHQIAKAAQHLGEHDELARRLAPIWAEWAALVDDRRGRKKR
jgi:hypothetical protein